MSDSFDPQLEALAEAIVFAHEDQASTLPNDAAPTHPSRMVPAHLALEQTAALVACALAGSQPVPERLQRRLTAAGLAFCAGLATNRAPREQQPLRARATRPSWSRTPPFLFGVAAGAALLFALQGRGAPTAPNVMEQRASVLATDAAAVRIPWQPGPSPLRGELQGDVVWSQDRQEGYLTFHGLPPLDSDHRFQLWIVDGNREGAPVDGGLFAIADAATETIVPIRARLPIGKPAAFVVTVETSAGVVVSKQQHVVALAGL